MRYKYSPTSVQDKVHSRLLYNVIEGENRIAQIEITFYLSYGKKETSVHVVRPRPLRYDLDFQKEVREFANNLIKEYEVVEEEDARYWVRRS